MGLAAAGRVVLVATVALLVAISCPAAMAVGVGHAPHVGLPALSLGSGLPVLASRQPSGPGREGGSSVGDHGWGVAILAIAAGAARLVVAPGAGPEPSPWPPAGRRRRPLIALRAPPVPACA